MSKKLSEMTLEELWTLFPIRLTAHNDEWAEQYAQTASFLKEILAHRRVVRISHIGSTAVKGIWAKPIVDILVEIASDEDMAAVSKIIQNGGFIKMSQSDGRVSFNSGYTEKGFAEKVCHLHLRFVGDNDELYFRDRLADSPAVAEAYQKLKLDLWRRFEHDRDAYTCAKTEFVETQTAEAKKRYKNRYGQP